MTKTVRIYGIDVEFTDKAPSEDAAYWVSTGIRQHIEEVSMGYTIGGLLPHETGWLWSAPLVPSDKASKAIAALSAITSGHFYQSSCRGGELERLMSDAIRALGGGK